MEDFGQGVIGHYWLYREVSPGTESLWVALIGDEGLEILLILKTIPVSRMV